MIKQIVLCLLGFSVAVSASNAAVFINTPWESKTAGMGGAVTSVYGQFNTPAVNPAGLYGNQKRHASITTYRIIDADYTVLNFISPTWFQSVLGISTVVVMVDGGKETVYDRTQHQYVHTGRYFGYAGDGMQVSLARSVFKHTRHAELNWDIDVIAGVTARWVNEHLTDYRASGNGLDIGTLTILKHDWLSQRGWKHISWGLSVQNSAQSGIRWNTASKRQSDMPKIIRTGLGLQSTHNTLLTIDVHKRTNRDASIILGGQYYVSPFTPIRVGITPNQSLSFGLGFYIGSLQFDTSITTAMRQANSADTTNLDVLRLTMGVVF